MLGQQSPVPYWRLSFFYFFYFALLGAWLPYWPLYLKDQGFDAKAIAYLVAIMMATKIVAPNIWGWLATISGQRMRIIRYGSFLACTAFLLIFLDQSLLWLALVITVFSFFWNAVLAQFEVVTLSHLGTEYKRYSQIRVWGSIGFIATVSWLGWLFDRVDSHWLPIILLLLLLGIWVSSLCVSEPNRSQDSGDSSRPFLPLLKKPSVVLFFLVCFLVQVSHGPYYTFFSVFLEANGYSRSMTGMLWTLGVLAEVLVFIFMHRLMVVFTLRQLMFVSLLLAALRWLLTALYIDSLPVLLFAQCLHAASFGSFHVFAIEVIRRWFQGGAQGQGMALYSGLCFGGGGAVGAVLSGWLWEFSPQLTFLLASLCCVVALLAARLIDRRLLV